MSENSTKKMPQVKDDISPKLKNKLVYKQSINYKKTVPNCCTVDQLIKSLTNNQMANF